MIWVKALIFVDVAARVAAFVCCVGESGPRGFTSEQPIVCYESGEHAPGKKKHYSVKYGSIIKPGASLPFVTPLPRRLTWCCSSPPHSPAAVHSQLTRVQLLVAERGCRLLFLYLVLALTSLGSSTRKSMARIKSSTLSSFVSPQGNKINFVYTCPHQPQATVTFKATPLCCS